MLQAVLKNKIGHAISNGGFKPIEDTLTSSVVGLMQYLPDELFWRILKTACGHASRDLPDSIGVVQEFHFWHGFYSIGVRVEPDVWVGTSEFDIIIEAKKKDYGSGNAQYKEQWTKQILSLRKSSEGEHHKPIIYVAIGGNDSLRDSILEVDGQGYEIHTASWYNLLNCVLNELNSSVSEAYSLPVRRILQDIVHALSVHHIIKTIWFATLPQISLTAMPDKSLKTIWDFDIKPHLSAMQHVQITNDLDLSRIWIIIESKP